jgi:hypothetical protein
MAGLLVTGFVLTAAANGKGSDAAAQLMVLEQTGRPCTDSSITGLCTEQRDTLRSQSTLANAAMGVLISGGVVAVATAAYVFWPTRKKKADAAPEAEAAALRAVPFAGPGGGGLWVSGAF